MKYLVFVILAAAACASEIEKREADPSHGYSSYRPVHHAPRYTSGGYHHYHKRSAEPEAEAEAHNIHKRSAEAEAEAEPSRPSYGYRSYAPVSYVPSYGYGYHNIHKRSAEAEAEAEPSRPSYGY